MNKKTKIILIVALVAIIIGIATKLWWKKKDFRYAGTLEVTKVDLPARVSAVIQERIFDEGDKVTEGQSLLRFACEDYKLQHDINAVEFERTERLLKVGAISKENYDLMKNKKQDSDLRMSWCEVRSPIKGTILNKFHEKGEMVMPGMRLFTLADVSIIYAYVYVPQPLVAKLKLGQKLTGHLPELDDKKFEGKITVISSEAEFTPKNVQTRDERTRLVYAIKVNFDNSEEILKPGMTLEVKID